jgi:D-beta-D-heptose 7-phosphate kinase/D-beta-D-heptose 1-phosphate adenosyltransferase
MNEISPKKIALVTGGFDPLHSGHIAYLKAAAKLGDILIVGLNSDKWLTRKKGQPFMPIDERYALLNELIVVDHVIVFNDDDNTACNAIEKVKDKYKDGFSGEFIKKIIFCNGGDRTSENIPEQRVYENDKTVEFAFSIGGDSKKNSSSWILENYRNAKTERNWGYYRVVHTIGKEIKVKELVIEPGQALSNQYHNKRNEMWYVMKGKCVVNNVERNEHDEGFVFKKGEWHKAENPFKEPCHILECQYGEECSEDDIVRAPLKDNYLIDNDDKGTYVGLIRGQEDDGYPD